MLPRSDTPSGDEKTADTEPRKATRSSGGRKGPRHFDRLTVRLAVGITVLVVGLLAGGLYTLSRVHFDQTVEARHRAAELQNRILAATLRHQMREKDRTLIDTVLQDIGTQPEVSSAMILDHEGIVKHSSQPRLVGTRIRQDSPACLVCHSKNEDERDRWALLEMGDAGVLRSVLPFENDSSCHECHDPERRINGILIFDVSLAGVQEQLHADALLMGAGTIILALLLLGGVSFLVRRLILVRLQKLGRTAQSIAAGNLDERAVVEGEDTIATLAGDFNNMAEATSLLIAEVRDRESQLTSVMNSLDDGLVVLDRDFRIVGANRSFSRRVGAYPEALRHRSCLEGVGGALPCCPSGETCPAGRCLATGEVQRAIFRDTGDHGRVEEVYASPIVDEHGKVTEVVEIWRDITERVREEERLAEVERLVSLGVLASGLSHEVSTPLASMLTCAESVIRRIDESPSRVHEETMPAIRESADIIRQEVLRCRKITERFRRFSRGIPPSLEPIDLRQVVQSVVSLAVPTAREAGVTIRVLGEDTVPAVTANTEVVQHVILNLLVNAIQSFDAPGGNVVIRFRTDSRVRIQVSDTGRGIPPVDREHLFELFRSRKPGGTGLGLFLSRSFMRRFGGDVRLVETRVGAGSCFEVLFPLTDGNGQ